MEKNFARYGLGAWLLAAGVVLAQQPTASTPTPTSTPAPTLTPAPPAEVIAVPVAPAVAVPDAPKAVPTLPAGSTAAVGWNNPPKWTDVEQKPQYASVPGRETNVLFEDNGYSWRAIRNGPVTFYGGIVLLVVPVFLLVFFAIKGPFKLHDSPTGRMIERFNSAERMTHWTAAISFVILALTGIIILFGKYVLLPLLGPSAFSWLVVIGKNVHNFVGPLFIFSLVVMFFVYVKDNLFNRLDFTWLAKFGGLMSGNHVPAGRFNGGEKAWFWLGVVLLGLTVSISGLIMLFPNWNTVREVMAEANLVHAIGAVIFVAMGLGHIYIGTIGLQGAYRAMREGYVDETWAREHHVLWYEEVKSGKRPEKLTGAVQPAAGDD